MRICLISHILSHTDGQGRVNYATAMWLAAEGHQLVLVASELEPPLRDHPNVKWVRAAVPRRVPTALLKEQVFAIRARRAVRAEVRGGGPFDVIQMNGCAAYVAADVNVANFIHADWMKSPFHTARVRGGLYGLYHRAYTRFNMWWERRAYHDASAVVAVSDLIKQSLIRDVGIESAAIHTICPGVDSQEFRPLRDGEENSLRRSLGIPAEELLLVYAGDARTNRKNLDLVLEAMAASGIACHLIVAGRVATAVYPPMAERLGLGKRIHFLGMRSDMPEVMKCGDIFAFPSHYDPFALVVTEAMAGGLAPIVGPAVGAGSVIRNGENGFVLESSSDRQPLVAILQQLHADRALLARLRKAARRTAETLSWEAMARQYGDVYRAVAEKKGRSDLVSSNSMMSNTPEVANEGPSIEGDAELPLVSNREEAQIA